MPLVLEEDVRVANGFDPASASTLYWKQVPVLVKQHDREDQTEQLTFRILSGVTRQNHSLRVSLGPDHLQGHSVCALRQQQGAQRLGTTMQHNAKHPRTCAGAEDPCLQ